MGSKTHHAITMGDKTHHAIAMGGKTHGTIGCKWSAEIGPEDVQPTFQTEQKPTPHYPSWLDDHDFSSNGFVSSIVWGHCVYTDCWPDQPRLWRACCSALCRQGHVRWLATWRDLTGSGLAQLVLLHGLVASAVLVGRCPRVDQATPHEAILGSFFPGVRVDSTSTAHLHCIPFPLPTMGHIWNLSHFVQLNVTDSEEFFHGFCSPEWDQFFRKSGF